MGTQISFEMDRVIRNEFVCGCLGRINQICVSRIGSPTISHVENSIMPNIKICLSDVVVFQQLVKMCPGQAGAFTCLFFISPGNRDQFLKIT